MSAEWRKFNLGDLTDWSSGGTPSKKNTEFWIGTIPWISASSMRSTRYSESELKITPEGLKSGSRLAPMGSILLLVRGSILHQKIPVGITTRDVAFNQDVKAIQIKRHLVDSEVIDNWYLFYWFKANEKLLLSIVESTGIGAGKLDTKQLQGLEVDVPSWGEQQQIVACCKAIEEKEIINAQINQTLEQIAQAIFKSWFVDFEPVKAKIAALEASGSQDDALLAAMQAIAGSALFATDAADADAQTQLVRLQAEHPEQYTTLRATAELFPSKMQESELGEIPEGWVVSQIGDEVTVVGGGTPSTKNPEFWEGGTINWTTPKDLSNQVDKVLIDTDRRITQAGLNRISSGLLPVDTVLMSSRAPVGYLALAKTPIAVNQGYIAMKCEQTLSPEFVIQWCEVNMAEIKNRASGTTFAEISKKSFNIIPVLVPQESLISVYSKHIHQLYLKIEMSVRENKTLAELRDTLLPKLLSGELSISSAFTGQESCT